LLAVPGRHLQRELQPETLRRLYPLHRRLPRHERTLGYFRPRLHAMPAGNLLDRSGRDCLPSPREVWAGDLPGRSGHSHRCDGLRALRHRGLLRRRSRPSARLCGGDSGRRRGSHDTVCSVRRGHLLPRRGKAPNPVRSRQLGRRCRPGNSLCAPRDLSTGSVRGRTRRRGDGEALRGMRARHFLRLAGRRMLPDLDLVPPRHFRAPGSHRDLRPPVCELPSRDLRPGHQLGEVYRLVDLCGRDLCRQRAIGHGGPALPALHARHVDQGRQPGGLPV
jgi:hypothetical protein